MTLGEFCFIFSHGSITADIVKKTEIKLPRKLINLKLHRYLINTYTYYLKWKMFTSDENLRICKREGRSSQKYCLVAWRVWKNREKSQSEWKLTWQMNEIGASINQDHSANTQLYAQLTFHKFGNVILRTNFNVICILPIQSILSTKLKIEFSEIFQNCLFWKRYRHETDILRSIKFTRTLLGMANVYWHIWRNYFFPPRHMVLLMISSVWW
jgi:hypothetical protein